MICWRSFSYQTPDRHQVKPLLPFHLFQMKLIALCPGEYSSNTLESNPGGGRKVTIPKSLLLPISLNYIYPSLLRDERWKWCRGERIFPVFLIVAGNSKHTWKPSIFLHLIELLHLFSCSPATTRNSTLGHHNTLLMKFGLKQLKCPPLEEISGRLFLCQFLHNMKMDFLAAKH